MADAGLQGIATRDWAVERGLEHHRTGPRPDTREALLARWDATTARIDALWSSIDDEIHHRGQGCVYLRSLGIEPPPFYVRA